MLTKWHGLINVNKVAWFN